MWKNFKTPAAIASLAERISRWPLYYLAYFNRKSELSIFFTHRDSNPGLQLKPLMLLPLSYECFWIVWIFSVYIYIVLWPTDCTVSQSLITFCHPPQFEVSYYPHALKCSTNPSYVPTMGSQAITHHRVASYQQRSYCGVSLGPDAEESCKGVPLSNDWGCSTRELEQAKTVNLVECNSCVDSRSSLFNLLCGSYVTKRTIQ